MSELGRVATCTACRMRHWRPAPGAPGAGLHGAEWQAWHLDSLAPGAPVVCSLCHWWGALDPRVVDLIGALCDDLAAERVA